MLILISLWFFFILCCAVVALGDGCLSLDLKAMYERAKEVPSLDYWLLSNILVDESRSYISTILWIQILKEALTVSYEGILQRWLDCWELLHLQQAAKNGVVPLERYICGILGLRFIMLSLTPIYTYLIQYKGVRRGYSWRCPWCPRTSIWAWFW